MYAATSICEKHIKKIKIYMHGLGVWYTKYHMRTVKSFIRMAEQILKARNDAHQ